MLCCGGLCCAVLCCVVCVVCVVCVFCVLYAGMCAKPLQACFEKCELLTNLFPHNFKHSYMHVSCKGLRFLNSVGRKSSQKKIFLVFFSCQAKVKGGPEGILQGESAIRQGESRQGDSVQGDSSPSVTRSRVRSAHSCPAVKIPRGARRW